MILEEEVTNKRLGSYKTYGIVVKKNNIIFRAVHDISDCKDKIVNIIELCNDNQLSPIHLNELIDNFLYSLNFD